MKYSNIFKLGLVINKILNLIFINLYYINSNFINLIYYIKKKTR